MIIDAGSSGLKGLFQVTSCSLLLSGREAVLLQEDPNKGRCCNSALSFHCSGGCVEENYRVVVLSERGVCSYYSRCTSLMMCRGGCGSEDNSLSTLQQITTAFCLPVHLRVSMHAVLELTCFLAVYTSTHYPRKDT